MHAGVAFAPRSRAHPHRPSASSFLHCNRFKRHCRPVHCRKKLRSCSQWFNSHSQFTIDCTSTTVQVETERTARRSCEEALATVKARQAQPRTPSQLGVVPVTHGSSLCSRRGRAAAVGAARAGCGGACQILLMACISWCRVASWRRCRSNCSRPTDSCACCSRP